MSLVETNAVARGSGRRGSPTMKDVAALAGVSLKTVSNVVNDHPYISADTRSRVEAAIAELGYQLNASARNLRTGRTGLIGLAIPEFGIPYFAELAGSVVKAAEERGFSVMTELTGGSRDRELAILRDHRRGLSDGLLLSPLGMEDADKDLLRVDYPLVILGERIFGGPVDHVTMANVEGPRAAVRFLAARGAKRILALGVHPGEIVGSAALRQSGYELGLADTGLPFDPELTIFSGMWHRPHGAAAVEAALDRGVRFDAVLAFNDALALGALHALHVRGIRVPDEVQVVGFDDIEDASFASPSLTSVSPGRDDIARGAVEMLLERAAGVDVEPRLLIAPFTLVERESTRRI